MLNTSLMQIVDSRDDQPPAGSKTMEVVSPSQESGDVSKDQLR